MEIKRHEMCWFCCGCRNELQMFAHRNDEHYIVGWLFVCISCATKVEGKVMNLKISDTPN